MMEFIHRKKEIIKYLISGGTAAAVDLSILYFLTDILAVWYLLSAVAAFTIAFFVSFFLQKFWTFRDNDKNAMARQMAYFFLVGLINLGVNTVGMYILVDRFGLWHILSQIIISGMIALSSFIIYKFFIFHKPRTEKQEEKISLLIATGIFPPDIGGPATYVATLMEELPKAGFEMKIVTYADNVETESQKFRNGSWIYRISRRQCMLKRYYKYFLEVLKSASQVDAVYVQGPVSEGLPSWLACKLRKRKYILKIVGDYAWEQYLCKKSKVKSEKSEFITPEEFQRRKCDWKTEMRRRIQKLVARGADKIIVPSHYLKKIVGMWGIDENKIEVIYNSVDAPNIQGTKEKLRYELKLEGEIILSVGRLVPWKGFDELIEIVAELLEERPKIKLIIIGDGPEFQSLKLKVQSLKLEERIVMLGSLSHDEVLKYMRAADVFVLNTGYEGLSHVIIEAMLAGLPVITTDVGGNPELVEHQKSGWLVRHGDKEELKRTIKEALFDRNKGSLFIAEAKKNIARCNKERMLREVTELVVKFKT